MAQFLKAAGNGDIDKVEKLLDNIHFQNKKGESALHVAVAEAQLEMVEFLVNHRANVNLQEKKAGFTPLMLALAQQPQSYLDMLEIMMKAQPDLTIKDVSGQTALHLAAQYGNVDAVKIFLKAKANLDLPDTKTKMTPLIAAAGRGNFEIVQLLAHKGHAINAVDANGNTALHWTCMGQSQDAPEIVALLCQRGAKAIPNHAGDLPLHAEAAHCDPKKPWPSPVGAFLAESFPDTVAATNRRGLTAAALYARSDDAVDEDDEPPAATKSKGKKQPPVRNLAEEKKLAENAQIARAAAIARTKKRWTRQVQEEPEETEATEEEQAVAAQVAIENTTSPLTMAIIVAVIVGFFAVLYAVLDNMAKPAK